MTEDTTFLEALSPAVGHNGATTHQPRTMGQKKPLGPHRSLVQEELKPREVKGSAQVHTASQCHSEYRPRPRDPSNFREVSACKKLPLQHARVPKWRGTVTWGDREDVGQVGEAQQPPPGPHFPPVPADLPSQGEPSALVSSPKHNPKDQAKSRGVN